MNEVSKIPEFIIDSQYLVLYLKKEFVAYLRIAEGWDYNCAFCIIPKFRAPQRCRVIGTIIS